MTSVLIAGAGALGSAYGACLARSGADVQLLAREGHARAVQSAGGIEVLTADEPWRADLRAEWRPERIDPVDIVLLLTKSHDGPATLSQLPHLLPHLQFAVSLQNGIAKDDVLSRWCGAERTLGGVSVVGATLEKPGSVRVTKPGATFLGELPTGTSDRVTRLVALLEGGGLEAVAAARILDIEWSKLVSGAPTMTLTALARLAIHQMMLDPDLARCLVELVKEGAQIASASGVDLIDVPGMFPVAKIATAEADVSIELVHMFGRALAAEGASAVQTSMLEAVRRGRRLELDDLHGYLVAQADRYGVAAPLSRISLDLLAALDPGRDPQPPTTAR